jgi:hypothetical protein
MSNGCGRCSMDDKAAYNQGVTEYPWKTADVLDRTRTVVQAEADTQTITVTLPDGHFIRLTNAAAWALAGRLRDESR